MFCQRIEMLEGEEAEVEEEEAEENDGTKKRKRPALVYPHRPKSLSKGWFPLEFETEVEMLQGSRDFVQAIKERQWARVNKFLKHKVDLDFQNEVGEAPLHLAIAARHEALVRFLLGQGVNIDAITDEGKSALHYASAHNDVRLVVILLFLNANVHRITRVDGENALHCAAWWGNLRIAKRLIRRGIDFTCKANTWGTPLDCARSQGHSEMVTLLEGCIARQEKMMKDHMEQLRLEEAQRWSYTKFSTNWGKSATQWPWTGEKWIQLSEMSQQEPKRKWRHQDDEDDCVIFDPALGTGWGERDEDEVNCKCCASLQDASLVFCKNCEYALHDTCPGCNTTGLEFKTICSECGTELWAEEGEPADPYFQSPPPLIRGDEEYGDYSSVANWGYNNLSKHPTSEKEIEKQEQEDFWGTGDWDDWGADEDWGTDIFARQGNKKKKK